jgi:hypothetical protein
MRNLILGTLLLLAITPADAAEKDPINSAAFMLPYCKLSSKDALANPQNAYFNGQCFGMISGLRKAAEILRSLEGYGHGGAFSSFACTAIPDNTTLQQLVDVVIRYGEVHQDQRRVDFGYFAFSALHQEWPCATERSS